MSLFGTVSWPPRQRGEALTRLSPSPGPRGAWSARGSCLSDDGQQGRSQPVAPGHVARRRGRRSLSREHQQRRAPRLEVTVAVRTGLGLSDAWDAARENVRWSQAAVCRLLFNQSQGRPKTWEVCTVSLNADLGKTDEGNSDLFKPTVLLRVPGEGGRNTDRFPRRLWGLTGQGEED